MKVVIIGCGRTGSTLALLLSRDGHEVTVVDKDNNAFARLGKNAGIQRVLGHALDEDVLQKARLGQADVFFACTQGDNTNLMGAQVAQVTFGVQRVAAKINDPIRAEEYRKLGVYTISEGIILAAAFRDWMENRELQSLENYITLPPLAK